VSYFIDENKIFPDRITCATVSGTVTTPTATYLPTATIDASYVAKAISYTIKVSGPGGATYKIQGANISDFSDVIDEKGATTIGATTNGCWTANCIVYNHYRVAVMATSGGTTATAIVTGIAK